MRIACYFGIMFLLALASCRKKPDPVVTPTGSGNIKITAQNVVGFQPLILGDTWYQTDIGDSFKVSLYKYYITNVKLTRDDGIVFSEPKSYHLINEADFASHSFIVKDVPAGNYTKLAFVIGVDSATNAAGAGDGALSPLNGMSWDWNTGYIAAKLEGFSPQSQSSAQRLTFHIGGYTGRYKVMRDVTLQLPMAATTNANKTPNIHMKADLLEWFKTPNTISFSSLSHAMDPGMAVSSIADNYSDMFKVDHVD